MYSTTRIAGYLTRTSGGVEGEAARLSPIPIKAHTTTTKERRDGIRKDPGSEEGRCKEGGSSEESSCTEEGSFSANQKHWPEAEEGLESIYET